MKIRILALVSALLLFISCSKENVEAEAEPIVAEEVLLVGEDFEAIYSSYYRPLTQVLETQNLTSTLQVPLDYLIQRNYGNDLSFFSFEAGNFSLFRQNIITGSSGRWLDFYQNTTERSIIWGADVENSIFLAYFSPLGSKNLALLRMNLAGEIQEELQIEFGVESVNPPILQDGYLLIGYESSAGSYKIGVVEVAGFRWLGSLDLGDSGTPSYFIDEGQLVVLKNRISQNPELSVYELSSQEFLFSEELEINQFFQPGPIRARFIDQELYYYFTYAQPSPVTDGPAQYSLDRQSNRLIDMNAIRQELENERGLQVVFTARGIGTSDPPQFFIGYGFQTPGTEIEGGMLILDVAGNILEKVDLPYIPTAIISRVSN